MKMTNHSANNPMQPAPRTTCTAKNVRLHLPDLALATITHIHTHARLASRVTGAFISRRENAGDTFPSKTIHDGWMTGDSSDI